MSLNTLQPHRGLTAISMCGFSQLLHFEILTIRLSVAKYYKSVTFNIHVKQKVWVCFVNDLFYNCLFYKVLIIAVTL